MFHKRYRELRSLTPLQSQRREEQMVEDSREPYTHTHVHAHTHTLQTDHPNTISFIHSQTHRENTQTHTHC